MKLDDEGLRNLISSVTEDRDEADVFLDSIYRVYGRDITMEHYLASALTFLAVKTENDRKRIKQLENQVKELKLSQGLVK